MSKRFFEVIKYRLLAFFAFIVACVIPIAVYATPIPISTCQGLQDINLDLGADYELSGNVDCTFDTQDSGGALYNGGAGFLPIDSFAGTFNGNNYTITGLFINRPTTDNVGLFGNESGPTPTITNLGLIDVNITGQNSVGALIGWVQTGTVTNVYSTGSVSGTSNVGGLLGLSEATNTSTYSSVNVTCATGYCGGLIGRTSRQLSGLYATGSVTQTVLSPGNGHVGGLVGEADWSVANSSASGTVSGYAFVGGLVGLVGFGPVTNSYATGDVTGDNEVGGLVGEMTGNVVTSYATGDVVGTGLGEMVGGLVGLAYNNVTNSYARGSVTANGYVGGLIGAKVGNVVTSYATGLVTAGSNKGGLVGADFGGTATYAYWDKDTTGQTTSAGSDPSYGKTTSEMKTESTFVTWDFTSTWDIDLSAVFNNGYPYLTVAGFPTPPPAPTPAPTAYPSVPSSSTNPNNLTLTPVWAVTGTTAPGTVSFTNLVTDSSGNSYVIGGLNGAGTYDFGNSVTIAGSSQNKAFLMKYNSSGVAQWAVTAVAAPGPTQFVNIALSPAGDIYIVGANYGTQTYDYGNGVTVSGVITPNPNPFVIKYNTSGVAQWAKGNLAGAGPAEFQGITVDSFDNAYVVGYIYGSGSYDFQDGITISGASATTGNWLLLKYNSSGVTQWAKSTVAASDSSWLSTIKLDAGDYLYAAGGMVGTGTYGFGNSITAAGGGASSNFLLVKFDSSGTAQWAKTNSGTTDYNSWRDLAVATDGTAYAVGYTTGNVTANLGDGVTVSGAATGSNYNAVIAKYNSSGTAQWAKSTVVSPNYTSFGNIVIDTSGNSYVAGYIYTTGTFDFGDGVTINGPGPYNPLIVKYDTNGTIKLAKTVVSANSLSSFNGIALDSSNNIYVVGSFTGAFNFDLGDGVSVNGAGDSSNTLLAMYGERIIPTPPPITPPGPTDCGVIAPVTAPVLYQAVRTAADLVKLWFTPVNANSTGYAIIYGFSPGDERFGVMFDQGFSSGALTYEVGHLEPPQSYTFKIQAKNGCASGPWSNYITAPAWGGSSVTPGPNVTSSPIGSARPSATPRPSQRPTTTPLGSPTSTPISTSSAQFSPFPFPTSGSETSPSDTGTTTSTDNGSTTTGSEVQAIVESLVELSPQITDQGFSVGATVVAAEVVGEIVGLALLITRPLYIIYTKTPRRFYMFPIDYIGSISQGIWQMILGFFGPLLGIIGKKPGRGRVFDGASGKPLPKAYVLFFSQSGNLTSDFTDKLGQYELKPKPDMYELRVDKNFYDFPSKLVTVRETVTYSRIYVPGEKFEIKTKGEKFNRLAIPIDPARLKSSPSAIFAKAWHAISSIFSHLIPVLEIWAVIISGLAVYANPDIRYKLIFFVIAAFTIFDIGGRLVIAHEAANKDF